MGPRAALLLLVWLGAMVCPGSLAASHKHKVSVKAMHTLIVASGSSGAVIERCSHGAGRSRRIWCTASRTPRLDGSSRMRPPTTPPACARGPAAPRTQPPRGSVVQKVWQQRAPLGAADVRRLRDDSLEMFDFGFRNYMAHAFPKVGAAAAPLRAPAAAAPAAGPPARARQAGVRRLDARLPARGPPSLDAARQPPPEDPARTPPALI